MSIAAFLVFIATFLGVELLPRLKNAAIRPSYFNFIYLFIILTMAAFIKCGSSLPKTAFYRHSFKFGLKLRV